MPAMPATAPIQVVNMFGRKLKRASLMPDSRKKQYRAGYVYILDDVDRGANAEVPTGNGNQVHEANCDLVHNFFTKHSDYTVTSVRFTTANFTQRQFHQYWVDELRYKNQEDLVILYFHGDSGYRGLSYEWRFRTKPNTLNAWAFVNFLNHVHPHSPDYLLILDCFVATRFPKIWERTKGHTDITLAGRQMQQSNGQLIQFDDHYTSSVFNTLEQFVEGIDDAYGGWTKCKTIPEILARTKSLTSNPLRLWLEKTNLNAENRRNVYRLVVDPVLVRETGHLQLVRVQIQDKNDPSDFGMGGSPSSNGGSPPSDGGSDDGRDSSADDDGVHPNPRPKKRPKLHKKNVIDLLECDDGESEFKFTIKDATDQAGDIITSTEPVDLTHGDDIKTEGVLTDNGPIVIEDDAVDQFLNELGIKSEAGTEQKLTQQEMKDLEESLGLKLESHPEGLPALAHLLRLGSQSSPIDLEEVPTGTGETFLATTVTAGDQVDSSKTGVVDLTSEDEDDGGLFVS